MWARDQVSWLLILLLLLAFSGCVTGPKAERKSPLSYLDGESYGASQAVGTDQVLLPILNRRDKLTHVRGQALMRVGFVETPLAHIRLRLVRQGQVLRRFSTGISGEFELAEVLPNGTYEIIPDGDHHRGSLRFEVTTYEVTGLRLQLSPREP